MYRMHGISIYVFVLLVESLIALEEYSSALYRTRRINTFRKSLKTKLSDNTLYAEQIFSEKYSCEIMHKI